MSDANADGDGGPNYEGAEPADAGATQPPQYESGQESVTDVLSRPIVQAYIKAVVAVYALLGGGMGLAVILSDIVDQSIFSEEMGFEGFLFTTNVGLPVSGAPHVALFLGIVVGGFLAVRMRENGRTTMITGAMAGLAGTIVLWILSSFLTLSQVEDASVDVGGLLVNAIVLGALVGAIVAGTVYVVRNVVPDEAAV